MSRYVRAQVAIEAGASDAQIQAVAEAFRAAGIEASVRSSYIRLSAADLAPITIIGIPLAVLLGCFLKGFAEKSGQLAAEEAYRALKATLAKVSSSRPTAPGLIASVQVDDPEQRWTIHIPGDLSDDGYRALFTVDTSEWAPGDHIYYFERERRWTFFPKSRPKDRQGPR